MLEEIARHTKLLQAALQREQFRLKLRGILSPQDGSALERRAARAAAQRWDREVSDVVRELDGLNAALLPPPQVRGSAARAAELERDGACLTCNQLETTATVDVHMCEALPLLENHGKECDGEDGPDAKASCYERVLLDPEVCC